MASKKIEVIIAGDTTKLASALKAAGVEVQGFGDSTEESGGKLTKFKALAAAAATGGALVLASALKSSVSAAEDQQEAAARMATAFKAAGVPLSDYSNKIEDAEAKGRKFGFTDEEVQSSLGQLVTATHNGANALKDLGTVEDLARAKHESMATASSTLTKAMSGSTRAASQLGISILPVTSHMDALRASGLKAGDAGYAQAKATAELADKQATAQKVIDAVSGAVRGQADAFSKTGAGALASFHAQEQNLEASLGKALIPILVDLSNVLSTALTWITKHKTEAELLAGAIVVVVAGVKAWELATKAASAATAIWTGIQAAFDAVMDANPIVLVALAVAGLVAGVIIAYNKVTWFRDMVKDAFGVIKGAVQVGVDAFDTAKQDIGKALDAVSNALSGPVDFIKNNWKTLGPLLLGPVAPLGELVTHFGDVKDAAQKVWDAIKNGVGDAIGDIGKIGSAITAIPGVLVGIAKSVVGDAANIGASIINGIAAGVKAGAGIAASVGKAIGDAIIGAVNTVINGVDDVIGKLSIKIPGLGTIAVPKIPTIPYLAAGTDYWPGGPAVVGEQGPELVNLPRGSSVTPAAQTRQILNGLNGKQTTAGGNRGIQIDMRGATFNSPRSARAFADRLAFRLQHGTP